MSTQDNRTISKTEMIAILSRVADEVWDKGNADVVDEFFTPDLIDHNPMPGVTPGREGYRQAVSILRTAFPDLRIRVLHQLAEGDLAMDHWEGTATHLGDFAGIPPTGKSIRIAGFGLGRFNAEGCIYERWSQFNTMDLMQQLGVVPGGADEVSQLTLPAVERTAPMRPEAIAIVLHRTIEDVWHRGDLAVADEIIHAQAVTPYQPQLPPGPAGLKAFVSGFRTAFPDLHVTVMHQVIDGEFVGFLGRITGSHQGEFMGMRPQGKRVSFEIFSVKRLVDGKIVADWTLVDTMAVMAQIREGSAPEDASQDKAREGVQAVVTPDHVLAAYRALASGDMEQIETYWAADMVWQVPGHNRLSGWYHGRDAFLAFMAEVGELSDHSFRMEPIAGQVLVTGEYSCDLTRNRGHRAGHPQKTMDIEVAHVLRWRDGKVIAGKGAIFGDGTAEYDQFWSRSPAVTPPTH